MNRTGFLKRLIGIPGLGFLSVAEVSASQKAYLLQTFIAGFRYYAGLRLLPHMQEQDLIELRREPNNKHDEFAIAIYWQQEKIGFIPASSNEVLARLMDAKALKLVGTITHLEDKAQSWENVAIAVYFITSLNVPEYLTQLQTPQYNSLPSGNHKEENDLPDVFEYYDRIIALDGITDEAAKAYFTRYYQKYQMRIGGRTYVAVPDDGIYTYMYDVESVGWVIADDGKKYLEFEIG